MSERDKVVHEAPHQYVLIVDSRDPSQAPLSHILDNVAGMGCEPVVARSMEGALLAASDRLPCVALVHLGADPRPPGGGGANVATELRRRAQDLPVVLYTGRPSAWDDRGLAALRRSIALAHETRLVMPADNLVAMAARLATASSRLSADFACARPATPSPTIPDDHCVQSFLAEVERAFIVVALQCRSTGDLAARALGLAPRTIERRIHDLDIRVRSGSAPVQRPKGPVLVYVAWQQAPAATVRAASRAAVGVLDLLPGCLSARELSDPWLAAAVVHAVDVAAVVDAWKLARAHPVVSWTAWGTPSLPLVLLMEEIGLEPPASSSRVSPMIVTHLVEAGLAAAGIRGEAGPAEGLGSELLGALPDLRNLLQRLRDRIALTVYDVAGTVAGAARVMHIDEGTFAYWLKYARKREAERPAGTRKS